VKLAQAHGISSYLILEELIISYDFAYDFVFRVPVRPSVSAPPVLVEQCAACLLAGQEFAHQGNIFRRTDRLRGEYLEWEPCREPLVHPPRLQYVQLLLFHFFFFFGFSNAAEPFHRRAKL
jgi:hypothetical protein